MSISLADISIHITRAILPIIIIIGILGNSFNIGVLSRQRLYKHTCSRYFLAVAINNLFFTGIILIYRLLVNEYQYDLSNNSTISCRIISYITTLSSFISPYLLILASIDRFCASSSNVHIRTFSCIRTSQWMIFIIIAIFSIFFINILILFDIQPTKGFICALQANTLYAQIYIFTQVFLYAAIPPCLMVLFGFMTIRNTSRSRTVQVVSSRYNRTEQQLARMVLFQVGVYVLLTLPTSNFYLISALPNTISTTTMFLFLSKIFQLLFYCSYSSPFFLYLLSGRIYRQELIQLLRKIFQVCFNNRVAPTLESNMNAPIQTAIHPHQEVNFID